MFDINHCCHRRWIATLLAAMWNLVKVGCHLTSVPSNPGCHVGGVPIFFRLAAPHWRAREAWLLCGRCANLFELKVGCLSTGVPSFAGLPGVCVPVRKMTSPPPLPLPVCHRMLGKS